MDQQGSAGTRPQRGCATCVQRAVTTGPTTPGYGSARPGGDPAGDGAGSSASTGTVASSGRVLPPDHPEYVPRRTASPYAKPEERGVTGALFDLSFEHQVAPKLLKVS